MLSFGSWVTFDNQLKDDLALECMQAAHDAGCNFFDNAEVYAGGESEAIMGRVLAELGWPRWSYVLTTKVFWGIHDAPNMRNTLNRKYLMHAIDGSLERLGLDFVDVLYCHRSDPDTPIEETVWAMSDIVVAGKALYWGTSEWSADEIRGAIEIAERHHLHKPVTEQPQYNLLERRAGRAGVRPAVRRDRLRGHDLEPAGIGPAHRQVPRRHPATTRGARCEGYGWLAKSLSDDARRGQGRAAAPDRRRARLLAGPAGAGVVHEEPQRVDGDHRRQPAEPGGRELRRPRRHPALDAEVLERIDAAVADSRPDLLVTTSDVAVDGDSRARRATSSAST